ncbi:pirin family protein [Flavobacteriaceae bacterium]|nr:pirin family protein [Flavobacteriaceae bacterium]
MHKVKHTANSRGLADHGWLKSNHSFSFANYYNSDRMNFGALRVLNDDIVQPKMGFGTHPHQNMEIISIPLKGTLSHKDSMNNIRSLEVNEVQVMSAGTGLTHSEFNDSKTDEVHFLQLWIIPEKLGITPYYNQKIFNPENRKNKFQTLVSPRTNPVKVSLTINQQAYISIIDLDVGVYLEYNLHNAAYFFVISGKVMIENEELNDRDALGITMTNSVSLRAISDAKLIVIDVPVDLF